MDYQESIRIVEALERIADLMAHNAQCDAALTELAALRNSEMWQAGLAVRNLRPREKARALNKNTKGIQGRSA